MVRGDYHLSTQSLRNCEVLEPPTDTSCEKNWLPIDGTNTILYAWHPLQIGTVRAGKLDIQGTHATPLFFRHLRGSAIPLTIGSELWALVHYVEYSQPRKYFHCIVRLDAEDYAPRQISLPFVFHAQGIEYCLGWSVAGDALTFCFSSWDDNPRLTTVPLSRFEWIKL